MTTTSASARFVLGTMNFGGRVKEAEARAIAERCLGHMLPGEMLELDTANMYAQGESEGIVGRIVAASPRAFGVATKVGLGRRNGKSEGLSRGAVHDGLRGSLERLRLPAVDVLYLHAPDRQTPVRETAEALKELHDEGLFFAWGFSNFSSWRALELRAETRAVALVDPCRSQVIDNLLARGIEVEHQEFAASYGLETVAYNPLAGGLLAGTVRRGETPTEGRFHKNAFYTSRYMHSATFDSIEALAGIAARHEMTLMELAYRHLVHHRGHAAVLLGPSKAGHVDAAFSAAKDPLPADVLRALNALWSDTLPAQIPSAR